MAKFHNVILQDGSFFKVYSALADVFLYRFKTSFSAVLREKSIVSHRTHLVKFTRFSGQTDARLARQLQRIFSEKSKKLFMPEFFQNTAKKIMQKQNIRWVF
ncbi:hypothetical protein [Xenorhabdus vietnamensis]|uniref:hypothetical protein n=1 Tax=Xenorhabdus vietnamensis TaxID=351656 RepID=UPI000A31FB25|nr:hypothetical protein [Xenorhabdus vietnamensis]